MKDCGTYIFPAKGGLAAFTVDVGHGVQAGQQDTLFGGATAHVDTVGARRRNYHIKAINNETILMSESVLEEGR